MLGAQVLYALTAGIAGYVAAVTYKVLGGAFWVRNTLLTATLFCGPLLVTFRWFSFLCQGAGAKHGAHKMSEV